MRTVLLGSDFMYNSKGDLVPIEMNTSVGWDGIEKIEDDADCLDLTALENFIQTNGFTLVCYIGGLGYFSGKLNDYCVANNIQFENYKIGIGSITIPYIEDNAQTLIIRSSYDTTAIVDENYCRDKVEFMKLIKDQTFGSQFAYMDSNNQIVSNITDIRDNLGNPNFILKSRLPNYDTLIFPKFYKVSNQSELDIILQNVTSDYFLMEFYFNPSKLYNNHIKVIRSLNILFPPNLESIHIGQYTKLDQNSLIEDTIYDASTFELDSTQRNRYSTMNYNHWMPKLEDTDLIEMADGTFKSALDLQIDDMIKTIDVPNPNNIDIVKEAADYLIDYTTLLSGSTYTTNKILNKVRVNKLAYIGNITFTDNSTWSDTAGSNYLIDRNNDIKFISVESFVPGDEVILIDTTIQTEIAFIKKTVQSVDVVKDFFGGWEITVERVHLFLTKASSTNNSSFVAIEHNSTPCSCTPCSVPCLKCGKAQPYCSAGGICTAALC